MQTAALMMCGKLLRFLSGSAFCSSSVFVYLAIMKHNSESSIVLCVRQQWLLHSTSVDCNTTRLIFEVLFSVRSSLLSPHLCMLLDLFHGGPAPDSVAIHAKRIIMSVHMNIA